MHVIVAKKNMFFMLKKNENNSEIYIFIARPFPPGVRGSQLRNYCPGINKGCNLSDLYLKYVILSRTLAFKCPPIITLKTPSSLGNQLDV